ncbi:MAG: hypothetical protein IPG88_12815 [Gemmatimonadetes bacterium]|nr:hypothetical protein [Gemmatimonadota bacterium]
MTSTAGAPLAAVTMRLMPGERQVQSDSTGRFRFDRLTAGRFTYAGASVTPRSRRESGASGAVVTLVRSEAARHGRGQRHSRTETAAPASHQRP